MEQWYVEEIRNAWTGKTSMPINEALGITDALNLLVHCDEQKAEIEKLKAERNRLLLERTEVELQRAALLKRLEELEKKT